MKRPAPWKIAAETVDLYISTFRARSGPIDNIFNPSDRCLFWIRESVHRWGVRQGLKVREDMNSVDKTRMVMETPRVETAGYIYVLITRRRETIKLEVKHRTTFSDRNKQKAAADYVTKTYDLEELRWFVTEGIDECSEPAPNP